MYDINERYAKLRHGGGTIRYEFDYDAQGNVIAKCEAVGTSLERQMLYAHDRRA